MPGNNPIKRVISIEDSTLVQFDEDGNMIGHPEAFLTDDEVFKSKEKMMQEYPKCNPIGYMEGQIEDPTFVDEDGSSEEDEQEEDFQELVEVDEPF